VYEKKFEKYFKISTFCCVYTFSRGHMLCTWESSWDQMWSSSHYLSSSILQISRGIIWKTPFAFKRSQNWTRKLNRRISWSKLIQLNLSQSFSFQLKQRSEEGRPPKVQRATRTLLWYERAWRHSLGAVQRTGRENTQSDFSYVIIPLTQQELVDASETHFWVTNQSCSAESHMAQTIAQIAQLSPVSLQKMCTWY